jgi:hypothetical protein
LDWENFSSLRRLMLDTPLAKLVAKGKRRKFPTALNAIRHDRQGSDSAALSQIITTVGSLTCAGRLRASHG